MTDWYYKPKSEGDTIREPIHGEFFAVDAISRPGMALVREAIQNSLDARDGDEKVLVRIFLSGDAEAAPWEALSELFNGAWGHLTAEDNGLNPENVPRRGDNCPYLIVEDFGTTGLEGDPAEAFRSRTGAKNHFYHFFRAEGQTDKEASDRGSWGVGKHVFVRSSRISTMLGLTVRASDGQPLLMGKTILKSHYVGDDYYQDGYYGLLPDPERTLVMPVTDGTEIAGLTNAFNISRTLQDPGFSVIVPWVDQEITEQDIVRAVLNDYFYPILAGQLDVIVETPGIMTVLDADSLLTEVGSLDAEVAADLMPRLELAVWARDLDPHERYQIEMPQPSVAWKWSEELIPGDQRSQLRQRYREGEPLAVRVPVTVIRKDGRQAESYFDIYLERDETNDRGGPVFIRDGIIIPRVDAPRTRGVSAIVIAEDSAIAGFLRTAENPSHTEWLPAHLKDVYRHGCISDLKFVMRSVHELVRLLVTADGDEDPTLLIDFFSIPMPESEDTTDEEEPAAKEGRETPGPTPPQPRPQAFLIQRSAGGFSIIPGRKSLPIPSTMVIRMAYDVQRGSPLSRYNESDFRVDAEPIRIYSDRNVVVRDGAGNRIVIEIQDKDFHFGMTGFDERRQLYVKADLQATQNGNQTT